MTATSAPGHRRRLPRLRWFVAAALVLIVVWLAWCALLTLRAVHQLQQGQTAVTQVRGEVSTADLADNRAAPALDRAAAQFAAAHRNLDSAWLVPLHVLPYAGRQLRAADALSGAAMVVSDAGQIALGQAHTLLQAPHQTPAQRTVVVGRLASTLSTLRGRIDHLNLGPSNALVPALAQKRAVFVTDLAKVQSAVDRGAAAASAATDLLTGPHTYLVLTANNAEMRAGSGMFLEVGTLSTSQGQLTLGPFVSTNDLASPGVPLAPVTGDLAARWGYLNPSEEWRNLAASPQFGESASLAAAMWQAQKGQHVDGVISVDVAALKDLLGVTGPITAGGRTTDAAGVEQYLLRDQYAGATDTALNQNRRDALGALAGATFQGLQRGGLPLPRLATALADAVNGRHLVIWSRDQGFESDWIASGAGGRLARDNLLLGILNQGANKLDPYQAVSVDVRSQPAGRDTRLQIAVTMTNHVPAGLPPYAFGTGGPSPGAYTGTMALDFPRYAGYITVAGGDRTVSSGPDDTTDVLATSFHLSAGQTRTITWTLTLPDAHGQLQMAPSARLPASTWHVQLDHGSAETFTDSQAHTVNW